MIYLSDFQAADGPRHSGHDERREELKEMTALHGSANAAVSTALFYRVNIIKRRTKENDDNRVNIDYGLSNLNFKVSKWVMEQMRQIGQHERDYVLLKCYYGGVAG
jgi:hypothetical protein